MLSHALGVSAAAEVLYQRVVGLGRPLLIASDGAFDLCPDLGHREIGAFAGRSPRKMKIMDLIGLTDIR